MFDVLDRELMELECVGEEPVVIVIRRLNVEPEDVVRGCHKSLHRGSVDLALMTLSGEERSHVREILLRYLSGHRLTS
jgi:hypothetical protein